MLKIIGGILIAFGIIDIAGAWFLEFDLWGEFLGVQLPDILWSLSGYIETGLGFFLFNLGSDD